MIRTNIVKLIPTKQQTKILKSWDELALPNPGAKMMFKYLNTNLWIFKTPDNTFGFLCKDCLGGDEWEDKIKIINHDWVVR